VSSCTHSHRAPAEVTATSGHGPRVYERHDPTSHALHRVVRENLETFYAAIEEGWQTGLPEFVRADALALLARLASAVPPPRVHTTRYSGVLAPAAHWRPLVIPAAPADASAAPEPVPAATSAPAPAGFSKPPKPQKTGRRCRYIKWAELLQLTFGLNVAECPACRGRMELRALVRDRESIERFLRHQGLWSPPPFRSPARAPPYHRSVTRLTPSSQQELFADS
jgi:hypothetical protein